MKKTIVCLIGSTAVGKTEVALSLAKRIDAEIISCDSMQIYKGIDIASSKPLKKERRKVPHHLIDILSPSREYNAALFRKSCLKIIKALHKRGKLPLIVCGTGLYLRALLDGLFTGPGRNVQLRRKFYQQSQRYGTDYLYKKLKDTDPQAAKHIHPHDLRRIVRALEVHKCRGIPISTLREKTCGIRGEYELRLLGLRRPRLELYARIEKRVEQMFRRGLVAEIRRLSKGRLSRTAGALLGYKEISGFLDGKYSREEAAMLLKRNTRRYAKRQLSWFRKEKGVKWIEVDPEDTAELVGEKICALLSK